MQIWLQMVRQIKNTDQTNTAYQKNIYKSVLIHSLSNKFIEPYLLKFLQI